MECAAYWVLRLACEVFQHGSVGYAASPYHEKYPFEDDSGVQLILDGQGYHPYWTWNAALNYYPLAKSDFVGSVVCCSVQ